MPVYHATIKPIIIDCRLAQDKSVWVKLKKTNDWVHRDDPRAWGARYDANAILNVSYHYYNTQIANNVNINANYLANLVGATPYIDHT